jgi:hypothetical protein
MSFFTDASFVMDPSVYRAGTLFVPKPTDGSGDLTFTRSSGATRVGPNGYIEKVRENLLLQSNSFDTTWTNTNSTETGGQAGYDGTNNAWLLQATNTTQARLTQTQTTNGLQTFSVYAKAGTSNFLILEKPNTGTYLAWFNLSNGTLGTVTGGTATITSVGNGWYRCAINGTPTASSDIRIFVSDFNNSGSVAIGGNILIQNAQLEVGDIATDYIPTTTTAVTVGPVANIPRLDYFGDNCPKLLLEPQRINLAHYSEQFNNVYWGAFSSSITANSAISPDGYQNADNMPTSSGLGNGLVRIFNLSSSTQYYFSIYAKSNGATSFKLRLFDGSTGGSNTETKTPTNEWQRFDITRTSGASTSQIRLDLFDNDGDLLIYGAQFEAGAYPTSYIPTLGSAVTRNADAAVKTGASSFIGQTEGTIFWEGVADGNLASTNLVCFDFAANSVYITKQGNNIIRAGIQQPTGSFNLDSTAVFGKFKVAIAYKNGDTALYLNGALAQASTNAISFASSLTQLNLGVGISFFAAVNKSECSQALVFKTRLSNADLARLTSI